MFPRMYDQGGLEGRMARRQLTEICEMADELLEVVGDSDDLPEWVQIKLATIHDRLQSVHSYMAYEARRPSVSPYPHMSFLGKYASVEYRGRTFPGYNQHIYGAAYDTE